MSASRHLPSRSVPPISARPSGRIRCARRRTDSPLRSSARTWRPMSFLITLDGLSAHAPDGRVLFDNLSLTFGRERTGLVGRNGVGKTTLLRLILGEAEPGAGAVSVSGRIAVLRQALSPPSDATLAELLDAAGPLARLRRL